MFLLLPGCVASSGGEIAWSEGAQEYVWPEPPDRPRLKYLRSLRGGDDFRREGGIPGALRWLTGREPAGLALASPYGVTADGAGRVWVADVGNKTVFVFDLDRGRVDYITSAGGRLFGAPVGVAYNVDDRLLYVSDSLLRQVFVLDDEGGYVDELRPPGGFGRPAGLALGPGGSLYVADVLRGTIEVFSREGRHLKSLGGEGTPVQFNGPGNVFVDGGGLVHVTDSMNFRVVVLDSGGQVVTRFGTVGDVPGSFARPRGIAVDPDGHIYVADAAFDNIQIFDSVGRLLMYFGGVGDGPGQFSLPAGLFYDPQGRLYVADPYNKRVQVFQYLDAGSGAANR